MEVVLCSLYILESRADSTQKIKHILPKASWCLKKKSFEDFQNYIISNMVHYIHVCITEKSVLLETNTFKNVL